VAQYPQVQLVEKPYAQTDLAEADILLVATNDHTLNLAVYSDAKARGGLLVNVADTPHLCDFYMGSIVTKGPLKVGISTNGQSPTLAKRFRELLEAILPDDVDALAANLRELRARYKGDFEQKVAYLNQLTASMLATDPPADLGEGDENAQ
jgi:siroheme synthase-like protein